MKKYSLIYRLWCFFMDSKKGAQIYCDECNLILKKNYGTLITFRPYPGRLKWRQWKDAKIFWLVRKYNNYRWRKKYPVDISLVLNIKRIKPSFEMQKKIKVRSMPKPKTPIFFMRWQRSDEDVNKGAGI